MLDREAPDGFLRTTVSLAFPVQETDALIDPTLADTPGWAEPRAGRAPVIVAVPAVATPEKGRNGAARRATSGRASRNRRDNSARSLVMVCHPIGHAA